MIDLGHVAVVNPGGGAACLTSAAYLRAISKIGIAYKQIHGASGGAINAIAHHSGNNGQLNDGLKEMWLTIKNKDIYHANPVTWMQLGTKRASCYDPSPLRKLLEKYADPLAIRESSVPLYVSVTDVENSRGASINLKTVQTNVIDWVMASGSPPFLFPPVQIGERLYYDGGLGEQINLSFAIKNGADTLIILNPRGPGKRPVIKNGLDAVKFAIQMPLGYMLEKELRFIEILNNYPDRRKIRVILIQPEDSAQPDILDFEGWGSRCERKAHWQKHEDLAMRRLEEVLQQNEV